MEHVLFFTLLLFSLVAPDRLPNGVQPVRLEPLQRVPAVWSACYPTLVRESGRTNASVLGDPDSELGPVALYVTNRVVWQSYLEDEEHASARRRKEVAARLSALADGVLSPDSPPDALSPAMRELATACMDLGDLAVPVVPPKARRIASPGLAAFFRLYGAEAKESDWHAFARVMWQMPYRDAIHLLARVPGHFLGHAAGLVEQLGPPADFAETRMRSEARALIAIRLQTLTAR